MAMIEPMIEVISTMMTLRLSIRMAGLASVKLSQLSSANASTRLAAAMTSTR